MDAAQPGIFSAALALTFATAACGPHTVSEARQTAAYVAESEACPDVGEIERREQSKMPSYDHITSVLDDVRLPVAAKSRVCWYRVTYFDPTSANTAEQVLAKREQSRAIRCPSRTQWHDLEATRAGYLSDHAAAGRMTCFEVPKPNPESLLQCLEQPAIETLDCVEDASIVAARQAFELPCKGVGEVLGYGTRIVELAAEDVLPDMAACFYRVEYDEEVSGELGSVGGGLRCRRAFRSAEF